ncbi:MAG: metallophosphoesterase [Roseiarcus sp.]|jgi:serine/threonine protein phosphatase 1
MSVLVDRHSFALPRSGAPGVEIFAIGDIHGRTDLLDALLDEAAREPRRAPRRALVFLGDLIDRGPDSLGAIDMAIGAGAKIGADETIALMGNHETMMRLALDPATEREDAIDALETWAANGGDRVIAQFAERVEPPADLYDLLRAVRASLPARVADWLASLRPHWRSHEILFVHAGVNPRVDLEVFLATPWNTPLDRLDENGHWAWVRWPFLDHAPGPEGWSGLFVVHGHTPNDAKDHASHAEQIERFRLNLDAGSGLTGVAEMAIIRGRRAEVVAARGPTNRMLRGG